MPIPWALPVLNCGKYCYPNFTKKKWNCRGIKRLASEQGEHLGELDPKVHGTLLHHLPVEHSSHPLVSYDYSSFLRRNWGSEVVMACQISCTSQIEQPECRWYYKTKKKKFALLTTWVETSEVTFEVIWHNHNNKRNSWYTEYILCVKHHAKRAPPPPTPHTTAVLTTTLWERYYY